MQETVLNKTSVYDIDFKNPRIFLSIEEMYFGAYIQTIQAEPQILHEVKIKCLHFYIESISQILSRFPLKNSVFSKLEFL
jgi:hypothetical protein